MRLLSDVLALALLAGFASMSNGIDMAEVSGEVIYRERIAAPPNARLEVVLEDISRQDVAARRLGEVILENVGQPPYSFAIEYDPLEINPAHTYRVAARLYAGDELLFITDQIHQVITRDYPSSVTLVLKRVPRPIEHPLGKLPATFSGTLPCADCPGIDVHLNLLADGVYFLRETYLGRDNGAFDDIGRFLLSSDRTQLTLHGGREAPKRYALSTPDTLRLLDPDGRPIEPELDYKLLRQPELQPLEPRLLLRGTYRSRADAGRFRECLTGLEMPVAAEAGSRALEQAYLGARQTPDEALLVNLEGRIEKHMPMEGLGPSWTLVPERFIGIWPGESCPEPIRLADFQGTHWRLTLIDSSYPERTPNQPEPHLVFGEDGRLAGSDGCNRLMGGYQTAGGVIELAPLASTRMACPGGMAQASRFADILRDVSRYRVVGRHLEMLDEAGRLHLRFEAVPAD